MSTNRELVDAAWAEVMKSEISGVEWERRVKYGYKGKPYNSANTAYGRADALLDQVVNCVAPVPPVVVGDVIEIPSGTYTMNEFNALVDAGFVKSKSGKLLARAVPGTKPVVNGNHGQRSGLTVKGITFDGQLTQAECGITGKTNWSYVECTFRNYFKGAGANDQHSQAIALWGGNSDWVIDGCIFHDNGTTSHIWMSYFGYGPQSEWYNKANFPKNGCVKNCGFGPTYGAYFGVHYTTEAITSGTNIKLDPSNYLMPSATLKPGQRNPELYFDQKLVGAC